MSAGRIRSRALARRLLVASFLFLLLLVPDSSALGQPPPRHAPDTILVKFSPSALPVDRALAHALVGAHAYKRFKIVEGLQAVRIPPGMHVKEALEFYRRRPDVLYAEPNWIVEAKAGPDYTSLRIRSDIQDIGQNARTPR